MTLPTKILDDIEAALHPVREAVAKAVAETEAKIKADAAAEKAELSADVKAEIAKAKAAAIAATPGLEADALKAFDLALAAAVKALAVYGV